MMATVAACKRGGVCHRNWAPPGPPPCCSPHAPPRPLPLPRAVLCCGLQRAPAAVEAALLCLARCCASPQLQAMLLQRGVLGYVVPLLLSYDASHEGSEEAQQAAAGMAAAAGALPPADDAAAVLRLPLLRASAQATKNLQAQLAVRALAALAGYGAAPAAAAVSGSEPAAASAVAEPPAVAVPPATLPCAAAQRALAALLTETLAPRLGEADPLPLLRDLNSTVQTPQVGPFAWKPLPWTRLPCSAVALLWCTRCCASRA